jgi:DNA (cytosine-5)-methyltransferase 1
VHVPEIAEKHSKRLTVRGALTGVGAPSVSADKLHAMPARRSEKIRELIALIPKDGGSRKDLADDRQLECHKRSDGFSDVYGRMAWDDVAPTITSGCYNPSKGRFLHPSRNRAITLREAALLQGFPPKYKFDVSHGKEAIALMIGNALPPQFIAAHARGLFDGVR